MLHKYQLLLDYNKYHKNTLKECILSLIISETLYTTYVHINDTKSVCAYTQLQCSTFPTCSTLSVGLTPVASIDPLLSIVIVAISLVCGLQA